jgi:ribosomal-protein-alanine N-acetyltransferase
VSARLQPRFSMRPIEGRDLDTVLRIEVGAYSFPWTRGNFLDSLASGYLAELMVGADGAAIGYFVAMPGADELHLLNITVAASLQGRGHGMDLLESVVQRCHDRQVRMLWLEVRETNVRARTLYRRRGFQEVGLRRGYYPAPQARREDAVVMRLDLGERA